MQLVALFYYYFKLHSNSVNKCFFSTLFYLTLKYCVSLALFCLYVYIYLYFFLYIYFIPLAILLFFFCRLLNFLWSRNVHTRTSRHTYTEIRSAHLLGWGEDEEPKEGRPAQFSTVLCLRRYAYKCVCAFVCLFVVSYKFTKVYEPPNDVNRSTSRPLLTAKVLLPARIEQQPFCPHFTVLC